MRGYGQNIVQGLAAGMEAEKRNAGDTATSIGSWITNAFRWVFGIHSPSSVMRDQIGKQMMTGLSNGITDNFGLIESAIRSVVDKTKASWNAYWDDETGELIKMVRTTTGVKRLSSLPDIWDDNNQERFNERYAALFKTPLAGDKEVSLDLRQAAQAKLTPTITITKADEEVHLDLSSTVKKLSDTANTFTAAIKSVSQTISNTIKTSESDNKSTYKPAAAKPTITITQTNTINADNTSYAVQEKVSRRATQQLVRALA
jgi:hypothetical protein